MNEKHCKACWDNKIHVCTDMHVSVYVYLSVRMSLCVHTKECAWMWVCESVCMCVCACIFDCVCIYIIQCMYLCVHVCVYACVSVCVTHTLVLVFREGLWILGLVFHAEGEGKTKILINFCQIICPQWPFYSSSVFPSSYCHLHSVWKALDKIVSLWFPLFLMFWAPCIQPHMQRKV